jgi:c-di-AMP phosphodiesterase-like protein
LPVTLLKGTHNQENTVVAMYSGLVVLNETRARTWVVPFAKMSM